MLRYNKLYAIIFALSILISGVFSPIVASNFSLQVQKVQAQGALDSGGGFGGGTGNTPTPLQVQQEQATPAYYDSCGFIWSGTVGGCLAVLLDIIAAITGWLVSFVAKFFDWAIFQTIQSATYSLAFITEGWVIMRNVANMAFIFVLLYIAIQTILGVGQGTKKAIVTLVIMALLINFSMFFSKVVIDAGNILAHAFYSEIEGELTDPDQIENQEKSLSIQIVKEIQPQKLLEPSVTDTIDDIEASGEQQEAENANKTRIFILVALMSIIANIMMIWIFLSIGLMMLGRMVALAFAIIISPLAFISKVVPGLSGKKYIGFDKWVTDLVGASFMPAVFMFFLFIILKFLNAADFMNQTLVGEAYMTGILGVMIPAIFIIMLLYIAQQIAKSLAGEVAGMIGSALGKIAAVGGGLALGGAALGVAAVGRNTVGAVAKYTQNDNARNKDRAGFTRMQDQFNKGGLQSINPLAYAKIVGNALKANTAQGLHRATGGKDAVVNPTTGATTTPKVSSWLQNQEKSFDLHDTSKRTLEAKTKSEFGAKYGENVKYDDLREDEQADVKKEVDLDHLAKAKYSKNFDKLNTVESTDIKDQYENQLKRYDVVSKTVQTGDLNYGANQNETYMKSNPATGEFLKTARVGSYDARNLSTIAPQTSGFLGLNKMSAGLIAGIATAVRFGLKDGLSKANPGGAGVEYGSGKGALWNDMKSTLSGAIKEGFKGIKLPTDGKEKKD